MLKPETLVYAYGIDMKTPRPRTDGLPGVPYGFDWLVSEEPYGGDIVTELVRRNRQGEVRPLFKKNRRQIRTRFVFRGSDMDDHIWMAHDILSVPYVNRELYG